MASRNTRGCCILDPRCQMPATRRVLSERLGRGGRRSVGGDVAAWSFSRLCFSYQGQQFGFGQVSLKGLLKIFQKIALGAGLSNAHRPRVNSIGTQLLRQPKFRDWLALAQLCPGTIRAVAEQPLQECSSEQPLFRGGGQYDENI